MRRIYYDGKPNTNECFWFKDSKNGCEKQKEYFKRIKDLDCQLLSQEQKHLIDAVKRLKQQRYPQRKPLIFNENQASLDGNEKVQKKTSKNTLSIRKEWSLSLKGMALDTSYDNNKKKLSNLLTIEKSKQTPEVPISTVLVHWKTKPHLRIHSNCKIILQSLPCIPNVGHKTNIELENKLRIWELANGEFQHQNVSKKIAIKTGNFKRHLSKKGFIEGSTLSSMNGKLSGQNKRGNSLEIWNSKHNTYQYCKEKLNETADNMEEDKLQNTKEPPPTRISSHKSKSK